MNKLIILLGCLVGLFLACQTGDIDSIEAQNINAKIGLEDLKTDSQLVIQDSELLASWRFAELELGPDSPDQEHMLYYKASMGPAYTGDLSGWRPVPVGTQADFEALGIDVEHFYTWWRRGHYNLEVAEDNSPYVAYLLSNTEQPYDDRIVLFEKKPACEGSLEDDNLSCWNPRLILGPQGSEADQEINLDITSLKFKLYSGYKSNAYGVSSLVKIAHFAFWAKATKDSPQTLQYLRVVLSGQDFLPEEITAYPMLMEVDRTSDTERGLGAYDIQMALQPFGYWLPVIAYDHPDTWNIKCAFYQNDQASSEYQWKKVNVLESDHDLYLSSITADEYGATYVLYSEIAQPPNNKLVLSLLSSELRNKLFDPDDENDLEANCWPYLVLDQRKSFRSKAGQVVVGDFGLHISHLRSGEVFYMFHASGDNLTEDWQESGLGSCGMNCVFPNMGVKPINGFFGNDFTSKLTFGNSEGIHLISLY